MNNVPSSAILAIIAIVAAVLVGTFAISAVYSSQDSGIKLTGETTAQIISISNDLNVENGETLTGDQVKSCIKTSSQEEICIKVNNGNATQPYYWTLDGNNEIEDQIDSDEAKRSMLDKKQTDYYINPTDSYIAQFIFGNKSGDITGVLFQKQSTAKINRTDNKDTGNKEDGSVRTITVMLDPAGGDFGELTDDEWTSTGDGKISRSFTTSQTGKFTLPMPKYSAKVFLGWYNDSQSLSKSITIDMGDSAFGTSTDTTITYTAKWDDATEGQGEYSIQYYFMKKDGSYSKSSDVTLTAANTTVGKIVRTSGSMISPMQSNFSNDDTEEGKLYQKLYSLYRNGDYIFDSTNTDNVLQGTVTTVTKVDKSDALQLKVYFKRCYSVQLLPGKKGSITGRYFKGYALTIYKTENGSIVDGNSLTDEQKAAYATTQYMETDTSIKIPYGEDVEKALKSTVGSASFTEDLPTWDEIKSTVMSLPDLPDFSADGVTDEMIAYAAKLPTYTAN